MIEEKIKNFGRLPVGWDYGEGGPCPQIVIDKALLLYDFVKHRKLNVEVLPIPTGGITLVIFKEGQDVFIDLVVNENLRLDLRVEKGTGTSFEVFEEEENTTLRSLLLLFKKYYES